MAEIIRPRPQWTEWLRFDDNDLPTPISDLDMMSHPRVFAQGIEHVFRNLYSIDLPCCPNACKRPYRAARDSAREMIYQAVNRIALKFRQWPDDPGILCSIYHGNTKKFATFHAGAMFTINIIRSSIKSHIKEKRPNPCWECLEAVVDDLEGSIHHFYVATSAGEDLKRFNKLDAGLWTLAQSSLRHL
ncbi:hypothetical protein P171DRAFT_478590 [Karstenula rhodostoma CBS 690.94]|uniref:Uncharacterized protein n=1 Tax=Karstenula rhodostoma CBS 690.94 TaxID=1392251 RepID=A0A9P4UJC9_9PLEO|nr:hypothetical protein P171DRAFT_478590 [Karstenula rhodostoma CBS 690.94]